ncbi:MAG: transglutaminase-like domain-containing protein [Microbacteriaceae bacterium]
MQRIVTSTLHLGISGRSDMIFSIAAAQRAGIREESLTFSLEGREVEAETLIDRHGTRLHRLVSEPGQMIVEYRAVVDGRAEQEPSHPLDEVLYLRPSRYCQSDSLLPTARSEFAGLMGHELLNAVTQWVSQKLRYVSGSSRVTDGATHTLLERRGVCRDYAHLVIALLRARDVPARMAAVYAPGLSPMDFHAVAEALIEGQWWLVDATHLAPRQSMLRVATGRDAADISFLTNHWANVTVDSMKITATADELPVDDGAARVQLL